MRTRRAYSRRRVMAGADETRKIALAGRRDLDGANSPAEQSARCSGWSQRGVRLMKARQVFIAGLLACAAFSSAASGPDLTQDDAALIRHIKATNEVFAKVLGPCTADTLSRGKAGKFTYSGTCQINPLPDNSDCGSYKVTATGTVDTKTWATVRDLRLALQCSA